MNEIDEAIVRTSFSTIVGESRDFGYILTDAAGGRSASRASARRISASSCRAPPGVSSSASPRRPCVEGDVLATNDPWEGTGHLPDYVMISPVLKDDRVVAFIGSIAHVSDVGGHAGDIEALDVFSEGLRLPPCKLWRAGEPNDDVFPLIAANCRVPDMVLGRSARDGGTHRIGAARLREFLDDYGLERPSAARARDPRPLRDGDARAHRGAARRAYEFGLDIDGYEEIVHSAGEHPSRCGERGPRRLQRHALRRRPSASINCVYNTTFASTMFPFKCALVPEIPNNEGLFRPIHVSRARVARS